MNLAETVDLVVNLKLNDQASAQIGKTKTSLGGFGVAFKAVGVAAAAGFGFATKGALEAEEAQGKFMAATGKTREEAKKFVSQMDSLAGTSGTIGRTFEEIAATGTMVEQQFKVTGEEATELTSDILKFAKVTGQDAEQAAGDLEDALSSFGLEAGDAAGLMDQLVASSQKYGTDAGPAAIDALNDMAPALTAMGMGLDDGVELLNAFEVAGGDAGDAAKGLRTAVAQLKPGENIDDLIAKIAAIEDPILKNQAAVEAFGKKMGPELALLIKPGMTSLDEFGVSAEEAAGKVDTASEDMLTFGDRIKGFADKALAGAREVGNEFGPALTGLASLASLAAPFAKGLKGLFSGLVEKVLPTAIATGTATGVAEGEAHAVAATGSGMVSKFLAKFGLMTGAKVAASGVAGTAEGVAEGEASAAAATSTGMLNKFLAKFGLMTGAKVAAATAVGTAVGVAEGEAQAAAATGPGVVKSLVAKIAGMSIPLAAAGTTVGTAAGAAAGIAMPIAIIAGLAAAGIAIHETIGDFFAFPGTKEFIARQGQAAALEYAKGYDETTRQKAGQIMHDAVRQALEEGKSEQDALNAGEQTVVAYLGGIKTGFATGAAGAFSAIPPAFAQIGTTGGNAFVTAAAGAVTSDDRFSRGVKQMIDAAAVSMDDRMPGLVAVAREGGKAITVGLSDSIRGSKGNVVDAMDDLKWAMLHPLAGAKALARVEGKLTGNRLAEGLASENPFIRAQAEETRRQLLAEYETIAGKAYTKGVNVADQLHAGLKTFNPVKITPYIIASGSVGGINPATGKPWGKAMGGPVQAGVPYIVGERRPELFVPNQSGRILPRVPTGGVSQQPITVNVVANVMLNSRIIAKELDRNAALTVRR